MSRSALAQAISIVCIQRYAASAPEEPAAFAPSEVEMVVAQVSQSIGLSPVGIRVVPCPGVQNAIAFNLNRQGVPKGDYIEYDPSWVQLVVGPVWKQGGKARNQATVLFGHELGHLLGKHFTTNVGLSRLQKETEADGFAGCAASATGVKWEDVVDLLGRMRGEVDTDYPSREHSLAAAREGFTRCGRSIRTETVPAKLSVDEESRIAGMVRDFSSETTSVRREARQNMAWFISQLSAAQAAEVNFRLLRDLTGHSYRHQLGVAVALAHVNGSSLPVLQLDLARAEVQKALKSRASRDPTLRSNLTRVLSRLTQPTGATAPRL